METGKPPSASPSNSFELLLNYDELDHLFNTGLYGSWTFQGSYVKNPNPSSSCTNLLMSFSVSHYLHSRIWKHLSPYPFLQAISKFYAPSSAFKEIGPYPLSPLMTAVTYTHSVITLQLCCCYKVLNSHLASIGKSPECIICAYIIKIYICKL